MARVFVPFGSTWVLCDGLLWSVDCRANRPAALRRQEVIRVQVQQYHPPAPQSGPDAVTPKPVPAPMTTPTWRQPSQLGRVVMSVAAIAVGVVGVVDLVDVQVPASVYFAAPLTVIGLGLIVGAWFGRARWLIAIGAVLCMALGIAAVSDTASGVTGTTTWRPST